MNAIKMIQVQPPFKLSSGRVVMCRPEPNGCQFAYIQGSNEVMTNDEWAEFSMKSIKRIAISGKAGK